MVGSDDFFIDFPPFLVECSPNHAQVPSPVGCRMDWEGAATYGVMDGFSPTALLNQ